MTDFVYAKHTICQTDLEWRRCGEPSFAGGEPTEDLWCPTCRRRVEREEVSLKGALTAMLRESHDV
jgi:hypothetical protein